MPNREKLTVTQVGLVASIFMLHNLLPAIGIRMPTIVYFMLWALTFILVTPRILKNKPAAFFLAMGIWFQSALQLLRILFMNDKTTDLVSFLFGIAVQILWFWIAYYYIYFFHNKSERTTRFFVFIMTCYFITTLTTAIGSMIYPDSSRIMTANASVDSVLYAKYAGMNICAYEYIYSIVLIAPIILYMLKEKVKKKCFLLVWIVLIIGCTYFSNYTMAIFFLIAMLLIILIPGFSLKRIKHLAIPVMILTVFGTNIIATFFDYLSTVVSKENYAIRFQYLASSLRGETISSQFLNVSGTRIQRYLMSFESFLSSFPFGTWDTNKVGGHSLILDTCALYGILGIIAIGLYIYCIYIISLKPYRKDKIYPYLLTGVLFGILMMLLNPAPYYAVFTCIYPLTAHVLQDRRQYV